MYFDYFHMLTITVTLFLSNFVYNITTAFRQEPISAAKQSQGAFNTTW